MLRRAYRSYAMLFQTRSIEKPESRSVGAFSPFLSSMPTSSEVERRTTVPFDCHGAWLVSPGCRMLSSSPAEVTRGEGNREAWGVQARGGGEPGEGGERAAVRLLTRMLEIVQTTHDDDDVNMLATLLLSRHLPKAK